MTNNDTVTHELSIEELDSVAGGDFSWKGFVGAVAGGAAAGGWAVRLAVRPVLEPVPLAAAFSAASHTASARFSD